MKFKKLIQLIQLRLSITGPWKRSATFISRNVAWPSKFLEALGLRKSRPWPVFSCSSILKLLSVQGIAGRIRLYYTVFNVIKSYSYDLITLSLNYHSPNAFSELLVKANKTGFIFSTHRKNSGIPQGLLATDRVAHVRSNSFVASLIHVWFCHT